MSGIVDIVRYVRYCPKSSDILYVVIYLSCIVRYFEIFKVLVSIIMNWSKIIKMINWIMDQLLHREIIYVLRSLSCLIIYCIAKNFCQPIHLLICIRLGEMILEYFQVLLAHSKIVSRATMVSNDIKMFWGCF